MSIITTTPPPEPASQRPTPRMTDESFRDMSLVVLGMVLANAKVGEHIDRDALPAWLVTLVDRLVVMKSRGMEPVDGDGVSEFFRKHGVSILRGKSVAASVLAAVESHGKLHAVANEFRRLSFIMGSEDTVIDRLRESIKRIAKTLGE